jgi:chorismate synthase
VSGNSIGKRFVVTCFGESHGKCVGTVVDGCPPGLSVDEEMIQGELNRRRPVSDQVSTTRREEDRVQLLSGVFDGKTTGAPITLLIWNRDADSSAYEEFLGKPRPGHADYPALIRYGAANDYRGGGRFSGRLTAALVMAGAVAKTYLSSKSVDVLAYTVEVAGIKASVPLTETGETRRKTAINVMRCPDQEAARRMEDAVVVARAEGDSVGGIVECVAHGLPPGVGDPLFDSVDADMAKMLFDVPGVKGVEFGAGFEAARLKGSENNDPYRIGDGRVVTETNNAGGVLGGLTNGMPIVVRVAFKPTPSISKTQRTVELTTLTNAELEVKGRHDPCIVPRAVPVVEAAVALVLADHLLRQGL